MLFRDAFLKLIPRERLPVAVLSMAALLWSCQPPQRDTDRATILVDRAIAAAGGLSQWQHMTSLSFDKVTTVYDADGRISLTRHQHLHFTYQPARQLEIEWKEDSQIHRMTWCNNTVSLFVSGHLDEEADQDMLIDNFRSAEYVVSLPFRLRDEGMTLTYEGRGTLPEGPEVDVVMASYQDPVSGKHSDDRWWHYFDPVNFRHLGYMVVHGDVISLVINESFCEHSGFVFPTERRSYRVAPDGQIEYLIAAYRYDDWSVY